MKKLSISIVNTNSKELLKKCLKSIYDNPPCCDFEVLVVDNKSDDGSVDMIKQEFSEVILTENNKRYGYPKNSNINMSNSKGEYILILNEDVEIKPGTLDIGIKYIDEHLDIGLLACKMVEPNGKVLLTSGRKFPSLLNEFLGWSTLAQRFPKSRFFGRYLMSYWNHDDIREVDTCCESAMLIRRETIEEVGMMDEDLFFGSDGPEWCKRIKRAGWKVVFHPHTTIVHCGGGSSQNVEFAQKVRIEGFRSKFKYYRKHHGWYYAMTYRALIATITGLIILKQLMIKLLMEKRVKNIDDRLQNNLAIFRWAIYDSKRHMY